MSQASQKSRGERALDPSILSARQRCFLYILTWVRFGINLDEEAGSALSSGVIHINCFADGMCCVYCFKSDTETREPEAVKNTGVPHEG